MRAFALILLAALPCAAAASGPDDDFEPDRPRLSAAMGPAPVGSVVVSADLGWLRSGITFDLGLGAAVSVLVRVDTMLLYRGFSGQSALQGGLRFFPIADGTLRAGVELTAGQVLVPLEKGVENLTTVRGELVLGAIFDPANAYVRLAVRGVSSSVPGGAGWIRDEEAGLGVERVLGQFVVGAEVFTWARPGHAGMAQWRLRGAVAF